MLCRRSGGWSDCPVDEWSGSVWAFRLVSREIGERQAADAGDRWIAYCTSIPRDNGRRCHMRQEGGDDARLQSMQAGIQRPAISEGGMHKSHTTSGGFAVLDAVASGMAGRCGAFGRDETRRSFS
jgi:hypothetical protein